jgi:hypothetical protein
VIGEAVGEAVAVEEAVRLLQEGLDAVRRLAGAEPLGGASE